MKYIKKLFLGLLSLIMVTICITPLSVLANEKYYFKGRDYNQYIYPGGNQHSYNGWSTVILSTSANYYSSGQFGRQQIRLWSRMSTIDKIYSPTSYVNRIEKMSLRFQSTESRKNSMMINSTTPGTNTSSYVVPALVYDILSYVPYVPVSAVEALTGNIATTGTERQSPQGYDNTIIYYNPSKSIVDLPSNITWDNADYELRGTRSGAYGYFQYNLPSSVNNFSVTASGKVQYSSQLKGVITIPVYYWTGEATAKHTVNSN